MEIDLLNRDREARNDPAPTARAHEDDTCA